MTDKNNHYIQNVQVNEIPWHRITTVYKRATDFPGYFEVLEKSSDTKEVKEALDEIAINIEHQSTLWHSTPFALIFLARIFKNTYTKVKKNEVDCYILKLLSSLFKDIALAVKEIDKFEHPKELPYFPDMLDEKYLWSDEYDEEEDEMRYDEEDVFPAELFYSFFYYSKQVLLLYRPVFEQLNEETIREILEML